MPHAHTPNHSFALLSSSATSASPSQTYNSLVRQGVLKHDEQQLRLLAPLDHLFRELKKVPATSTAVPRAAQESSQTTTISKNSSNSGGSGWFASLLGSSGSTGTGTGSGARTTQSTPILASNPSGQGVVTAPKGVYMYGGVGTGKSMLMDLFYKCCDGVVEKKRRVHFHSFMLEVHRKMHAFKVAGHQGDPLPQLINDYLEESSLLCFDEFQVTDVADALIMRRLFGGLIDRGLVMVSTSNRHPDDLYHNGIQRHLFLPFIDYLKETTTVVNLNSKVDYRLTAFLGSGDGGTFLTPKRYGGSVKKRDQVFGDLFGALTSGAPIKPVTLNVQGRSWTIDQACQSKDIARLHFNDLCLQPRGAIDYLELCKKFHTLFVEGIPVLSLANQNNVVRRLINFVDVCYEARVKLVCTAAASPAGLVPDQAAMASVGDESFAFDRTISRLREMQSELYLQSHVGH